MKNYFLTNLFLAVSIGITSFSCQQPEKETDTSPMVITEIKKDQLVGRWSLYLPGGAGWLEIIDKEKYYDGNLLWYGGSVLPVSSVVFAKDAMKVPSSWEVVRERDENDNPTRVQTLTTWRTFTMINENELQGRAYIPQRNGIDIEIVEFTAKRLPPLPPAPDLSEIKYGNPKDLFNGKDLSGWILTNPENINGWKVDSGILTNDPAQEEGKPHIQYGNLRTEETFEDFNLKIEVNIPEGSNSGIYLRGIYEIQVMDSYGRPLDSHNMGALYSRITPSVAAEKPAGEWQSLDITLCDHHLTVVLNSKKIIDNQPVMGVTGGALTADEESPGPLYLQGDHGKVAYRNITLTPIEK
jgi:hypothetical protein